MRDRPPITRRHPFVIPAKAGIQPRVRWVEAASVKGHSDRPNVCLEGCASWIPAFGLVEKPRFRIAGARTGVSAPLQDKNFHNREWGRHSCLPGFSTSPFAGMTLAGVCALPAPPLIVSLALTRLTTLIRSCQSINTLSSQAQSQHHKGWCQRFLPVVLHRPELSGR